MGSSSQWQQHRPNGNFDPSGDNGGSSFAPGFAQGLNNFQV